MIRQRRTRRLKKISWKHIIFILVGALIVFGGVGMYLYAKGNPQDVASKTFTILRNVTQLLPVSEDVKKEIETSDQIVQSILQKDDVVRTYMILLQNNHELRPGGGFLGQYAIVKIKNGELESLFIEDANLADQRITAKVTPPYGLQRGLSIKKWKLRDSNFSPDFPTNVEKAQYFYRLSGRGTNFDGVAAVNADVFNHVFDLTGPISIAGYGEFNSDNATLKLEEAVERPYLGDDVPAELKQNRKAIMKRLGQTLADELVSLNNIPKIAELSLEELRNKNVMLWFADEQLQTHVANVHWDGAVAVNWGGDYLSVVDANVGALKSDYYVKRRYEYTVDFTGGTDIDTEDKNYRQAQQAQQEDTSQQEGTQSQKRGRVTLRVFYNHTAPGGDWRTSDYHSWTRVYTPDGSDLVAWLYTGTPRTTVDFEKNVFGYKVDALIGRELVTTIVYDLPQTITPQQYKLLVQKQSGVGSTPLHVRVITAEEEFEQKLDLRKDVKLEFVQTETEDKIVSE